MLVTRVPDSSKTRTSPVIPLGDPAAYPSRAFELVGSGVLVETVVLDGVGVAVPVGVLVGPTVGVLDGVTVVLGSPTYATTLGFALPESTVVSHQQAGKTVVFVARADRVLGLIAIADRLRESTPAAIRALRGLGITPLMLTGDNALTAAAIAREAGIAQWEANQLPENKLNKIKYLQSTRQTTGMAGDGVNDAPALAAADVSFAIGGGADVAVQAAGITLMRNDLMGVVDAIRLSRATLAKIRQNLFFAFFYNALGIPLAAAGLLNPMIAGAAMALSSVSVVSNALLLRRWQPLHNLHKP